MLKWLRRPAEFPTWYPRSMGSEDEMPDPIWLKSEPELKKRQGYYLPHWTLDGAIYHTVFRLADSLPRAIIEEWRKERDSLLRTETVLSPADQKRLRYLVSERTERYLDAGYGSCLLREEGFAKICARALQFFESERYHLHAWCVMPNHVHAIVQPRAGHELATILHSWKSFTSH